MGEGITGWVAEQPDRPEPAQCRGRPRASTIPGTEEDLDESMLLAPMLFEDRCWRPGAVQARAQQFSDDDLRLLVIYASFAAQADGQRRHDRAPAPSESARWSASCAASASSLQITESLLTTLDAEQCSTASPSGSGG
jgi:hypothetical protein